MAPLIPPPPHPPPMSFPRRPHAPSSASGPPGSSPQTLSGPGHAHRPRKPRPALPAASHPRPAAPGPDAPRAASPRWGATGTAAGRPPRAGCSPPAWAGRWVRTDGRGPPSRTQLLPDPPQPAHLRLRILTANSWPPWRWRQRRHTEKLPWPSAGSRRSSSYCWKKGESWGNRGCQRSYGAPGGRAPSRRGPGFHRRHTLGAPGRARSRTPAQPPYLHHGAAGHRRPARPVSGARCPQHIRHHSVVVVKQDGRRHEGVSLDGEGGGSGR